MEWTEEKMERLYEEIHRKFRSQFLYLYAICPHETYRHVPSFDGEETFSSIYPKWHDFLEQLGIYARFHSFVSHRDWMSMFESKIIFRREVLVQDPSSIECSLVVPKETAEKILVLGM